MAQYTFAGQVGGVLGLMVCPSCAHCAVWACLTLVVQQPLDAAALSASKRSAGNRSSCLPNILTYIFQIQCNLAGKAHA